MINGSDLPAHRFKLFRVERLGAVREGFGGAGMDFVSYVIVIEEMIRGRLHVIRQAEAGRANVSIARAYVTLYL